MKISYYSTLGNFDLTNGYSNAGYGIVTSLNKLGHEVHINNPNAPVKFIFCQPNYYIDDLTKDQYNIGLLPWESTEPLNSDWPEIMSQLDEVWATNEFCFDVYKNWGLNNVKKIYNHGINTSYSPKHRKVAGKLKFLHNGAESPRKGGQMAYDAFRAAFGNSKDVELILKCKDYNPVREYMGQSIVGPPSGNVKVTTNVVDIDEMPGIYHESHVMVTNSWGEGFGLPALEALATGMPTISTTKWADYRKYFNELAIDSDYVDTLWPEMHPGKMYQPRFDDLVDKYRYTYDNYDRLSTEFFKQSFQIHQDYDWVNLTKTAFQDVINRFDDGL